MPSQKDSFYSPEDTAYSYEEEQKQEKVLGMIKLNPGVTPLNFYCCLIFCFTMIFGLAAPGGLQPLILLDKEYYNISQDHAGAVNSLVIIVQSVVKIITCIPYGHLSDKFGRRSVITFASVNYLIGSLLVPYSKEIFPGFLLAKAFAANALSALQSVPLLADYVADESKGKAAAVYGISLGIGALIGNLFVKGLLYAELPLGACYNTIGIFTFVVLLINNLGLKKGNFHTVSAVEDEVKAKTSDVSFMESIKEAIAVFKANNWLRISLVLQVLGSSDFQVFMTFLALYLKSLFPSTTPSTVQNIAVNNLQTMIIIPMLIANPFYGYLIDKKKLIIQLSYFALCGGAVSFLLFAMSHDPTTILLPVGAMMFGSTLPGLMTITNYLNIKNFPPEKRGIMIGFCHLVSQTSYFIIATGGGYLYDNWRRDGLFMVCAGLLVFAAILVTIIYSGMNVRSSSNKDEERLGEVPDSDYAKMGI
jgi:MFS family permease